MRDCNDGIGAVRTGKSGDELAPISVSPSIFRLIEFDQCANNVARIEVRCRR